MKTDLFQSCGHCWVFQICWHIECNTFTASSFRIWKSSTGIPSPPLALFVLMLSKAHLTSHYRMSGSSWVIIPLWLSWSWRSFLYSSSELISHASKVMLKILQARLQQYLNCKLPDVQAGFRKGRGTRDQIANICWIIKKAREFQRIARRDKKAFLSNQYKEIEENNRIGKTRDLFKKIRDTKGYFMQKRAQ